MVKDHSDSKRGNPGSHHIGYSFWWAARVLLYASFHRQDNTYHSLCYTSRGALAGTRNSSMGPPHEGSIWRPITPWANALTTELHLAPWKETMQFIKWLIPWYVCIFFSLNNRNKRLHTGNLSLILLNVYFSFLFFFYKSASPLKKFIYIVADDNSNNNK